MSHKVYANDGMVIDDSLEEILYRFDQINENGDVIYDKNLL